MSEEKDNGAWRVMNEELSASGGWIVYDGPTHIAGKGVLKDGVMTFIPDPMQPPSEGWTVKPLSVANPEGIVPETKIEAFIRRLRDDPQLPATFEIWTHPGEGIHYLSHRHRTIGTIAGDVLSLSTNCDRFIGAWLRETWRSLDVAPTIPPRIHRFIAALTDHQITFKDDCGYTVKAPFTTTMLPSQNVIIVVGNGVEFGEVRGDDFTPDTAMPCDTRAILRHVWREVIREETLLNRIAALQAECAEKTRRLDQIAAALNGNK